MELRQVLTTIAVLALIPIGFVTLMWLTQRSLIYLPDRALPADHLRPAGVEPVSFLTDDGLPLGGWFFPAVGRSTDTPGPGVLVCNGNAGNRGHRVALGEALASRGFSVLLFDYRGYGGNPGSPSEAGLRADARAAARFLASRPEVDPQAVIYFGESLGASVAVGLASERPAAALILRSPISSLVDIGRHHYPYLPVVEPLLWDRYPVVDQIPDVAAPVLVVVASDDEVVPVEISRRVYDVAGEPKRWVEVAAAGHNDIAMLAGDELLTAVISFLADNGVPGDR